VITEFPDSEFARKARDARGEKPAPANAATTSPKPKAPSPN
jgi:hypothetical protein